MVNILSNIISVNHVNVTIIKCKYSVCVHFSDMGLLTKKSIRIFISFPNALLNFSFQYNNIYYRIP